MLRSRACLRSKAVSFFCQKYWSGEEGKWLLLVHPVRCDLQGFGALRGPYPKNNFPGSSEIFAIRVRSKISYFLRWIVEWISSGTNEQNSLSSGEMQDIYLCGTFSDTGLENIPWESKIPYCTPMSPGEGVTQSGWQMSVSSLGGLLEGGHALWWGAHHKNIQTYLPRVCQPSTTPASYQSHEGILPQ